MSKRRNNKLRPKMVIQIDGLTSRRRIEQLRSHRKSYLHAVASHHARVAQIAVDMAKLIETRPLTSDVIGTLEQMERVIERSHVEAFGVPTVAVENPTDQFAPAADCG